MTLRSYPYPATPRERKRRRWMARGGSLYDPELIRIAHRRRCRRRDDEKERVRNQKERSHRLAFDLAFGYYRHVVAARLQQPTQARLSAQRYVDKQSVRQLGVLPTSLATTPFDRDSPHENKRLSIARFAFSRPMIAHFSLIIPRDVRSLRNLFALPRRIFASRA
jgi:hypothetical protein